MGRPGPQETAAGAGHRLWFWPGHPGLGDRQVSLRVQKPLPLALLIQQHRAMDAVGEWERRNGLRLRFVYRRSGPSLLVAEGRLNTRGRGARSRSKTGRGAATVPIFLHVPQVKLPKRLDLARDAVRAHAVMPGLIVASWVEGRPG